MSDFKPELWKRSGSGKMGEGTRQKWGEHGGINKSLIVKEFLYSMLGNMKSIQREWEALNSFKQENLMLNLWLFKWYWRARREVTLRCAVAERHLAVLSSLPLVCNSWGHCVSVISLSIWVGQSRCLAEEGPQSFWQKKGGKSTTTTLIQNLKKFWHYLENLSLITISIHNA